MRSVSASSLRLRAPGIPAGLAVTAGLTVLLVYAIASSTVAAAWVPGSMVVVPVALVAALMMGGLALLRRVPAAVSLFAGAAGAPVSALIACSSAAGSTVGPLAGALAHPLAFVSRLVTGAAAGDGTVFLFALCLLFWTTGGWLAWCVIRWRQALLGLVPGAAAFATTLLNYPANQNGYMLAFLVLTLGLMLWTQYHRSIAEANGRGVRLSSDSRWDFWETGAVVTAVVVALGIFLPPLSRVDRTIDIENGGFRGWAELQQRLNHPVAFGQGTSSGYSLGFNSDVQLGPSLKRTSGAVFTYTVQGDFGGPRYFTGVVDSVTQHGTWSDRGTAEQAISLARETLPPLSEQYESRGSGTVKVDMLKPPRSAADSFFYPDQLAKVDRAVVLHEVRGRGMPPGVATQLHTVDRVTTPNHTAAGGTYTLQVTYSTATEDQLRRASTDYPAWLDPYRNFANAYRAPGGGAPPAPLAGVGQYRAAGVEQRIHNLALQVTAGATNPYDQAQAIESYLRANYTYNLAVPEPPADTDRLGFFLFNSKSGYCEYFATAMGDMLRSLGIPTRLVNGFGAGSYDDKLQKYVVRESDAHTWVEAYFPRYGWIPFEPTPDGQYFPIQRGFSGTASCVLDNAFCDPATTDPNATDPNGSKVDRGQLDPGAEQGSLGGGGFRIPPAPVALPILAVVMLLLAGLWVAVSRYLRPGSVAGVWKRTGLLARLGGVPRRPGETPFEFGARLGEESPEARAPAGRLAAAYAVAAYAPPELARESREQAIDAYRELLPLLLSRIRERNRFA